MIDIPAPLLNRARAVAAAEGTTLGVLVERSLRREIEQTEKPTGFRLRNASFRGDGVQPGIDESDPDAIRALAYEGRHG